MDWAQVLVIILAIFLAIFLLLAIILTALLIKVTHQIKSVTGSAKRTAETIERAVSDMSKLTSPLMILRLVKKVFKKGRQ